MKIAWYLPRLIYFFCLILLVHFAQAQTISERALVKKLDLAAQHFLKILNSENRAKAALPFDHQARFDWNYTPRSREGVTFKTMTLHEREAGYELLKVVMSEVGYAKLTQIINLEYVLRKVENRGDTDLYRDPENYSFLLYGEPGSSIWGFRFEGHHLSIHFTIIDGKVNFTPGFFGSNPATVLADVPEKGLRVLREEQDVAFDLLQSLSEAQRKITVLSSEAPADLFTTNSRKVVMDTQEGIAYRELSAEQQKKFQQLIQVYLKRYHVTLKNRQWEQLVQDGLSEIKFAWMGDLKPEIGPGRGHYYRIHGPTIFIEFDNTQNGGNHIHSVVRDLKNDFGEDLLRLHYEASHKRKK